LLAGNASVVFDEHLLDAPMQCADHNVGEPRCRLAIN
jgi:hypothetical protein